ncbi:hypothetical protein Y017_14910 [Alcanivorax sp. 97CO-5]|nr:hypothetical protein Y017_14910 [Alcanivorax sp. 97CO-5]
MLMKLLGGLDNRTVEAGALKPFMTIDKRGRMAPFLKTTFLHLLIQRTTR